eukprot:5431962-Pyramimonas_sp.AAC.1
MEDEEIIGIARERKGKDRAIEKMKGNVMGGRRTRSMVRGMVRRRRRESQSNACSSTMFPVFLSFSLYLTLSTDV